MVTFVVMFSYDVSWRLDDLLWSRPQTRLVAASVLHTRWRAWLRAPRMNVTALVLYCAVLTDVGWHS